MKYFTVNELCVSGSRPDLVEVPSKGSPIYNNLVYFIETFLDSVRQKLGRPIVVTSGYRPTALNIAVGGSRTSNHCFDRNTEILTNNGWRTVQTISQKDKAYTYNIEKELIELCDIDEIIKYDYDGNLIYANNNHINFAVTDEHRMLVRTDKHLYKRKTDKVYSEKGREYFDSLKTENYKYHIELAKDIFKKRRFFKCAGFIDNKNTYDINILKLCMAVIADGYIIKNKGVYQGVGFNLKKERKMSALETILNNCGYKYTKRYSNGHERRGCAGVYVYYLNSTTARDVFDIIGFDKTIPKWFLTLNSDVLTQLVLTYAEFDGFFDNREGCSNLSISSNNESNIDKLQLMSVFSNMRCVKKKEKYRFTGYETSSKFIYNLYITPNKNESKMSEQNYKTFYYKGVVWCIRTKNGTVITRRDGKISFQGNCYGFAADCHTGNNSSDNLSIVAAALETGLEFDEIIIEGAKFDAKGEIVSCKWVHLAKKRVNNRRKFLWTSDMKTYHSVNAKKETKYRFSR